MARHLCCGAVVYSGRRVGVPMPVIVTMFMSMDLVGPMFMPAAVIALDLDRAVADPEIMFQRMRDLIEHLLRAADALIGNPDMAATSDHAGGHRPDMQVVDVEHAGQRPDPRLDMRQLDVSGRRFEQDLDRLLQDAP
jgi:hypothetical protein